MSALKWLGGRFSLSSGQVLVLIGIVVVTLATRIAWVAFAARTPREFHDPLFYLFYANQISIGDGYRLLDGTPTAYYPVGYPGALAGVYFLVRHTPIPDNFTQAVGWFQIFLSLGTVLLAFYVGRRIFGVTAGLLAAGWLALFPNLIYHTGTYLSETLFNFLVMAAMAVLVGSSWPKGEVTTARLLSAGAILGGAALVRPIALLLLPLLVIGWLLAGARWKQAVVQIGLLGLATMAVITPWAIRNFVVMDAPIVISANLGDDLCIGHNPGATGHFELPPECFEGYEQYVRPEFEVRRNTDGIRSSIEYALNHPLHEVKLLALKARWTYEHDHDGLWAVESYGDDPFINKDLRQFLSKIADIYFFTTISIGGLGLIAILVARSDARRVFLALATLAFGMIPLAFFGDARFHVPAMPLLVLAGSWAVVAAIEQAPRLVGRASGERIGVSGIEVSERERAVPEQDAL